MTFGLPLNMRENGVRMLTAWCLGRGCHHHFVLDVSGYPTDLPVPSFGPRLRCTRCGHLGANARLWCARTRVSCQSSAIRWRPVSH